MEIKVYTTDRYLFRKIQLELLSFGQVTLCEGESSGYDDGIFDLNTENGRILYVKLGDKTKEFTYPIRLGELKDYLSKSPASCNSVVLCGDRQASVCGRTVKLSELEYALLSLLLKHKRYVSKGEILRDVWKGQAEAGVVNVYIHYLRQKLEKSGEKIILSSRQKGYTINQKYTEGGGEDA